MALVMGGQSLAKKRKINFEASLAELEALVEKMERGEFSLEESLKQFERGIALARACHAALRDAEQKVAVLTRDEHGNEQLADFDPDDE